MILPNGKMLSAADVAASADIQGGALCTTVDKVCVSFAKDMASAVFCMSEGDAVVRCTTVLKKDPVSNGWRIFLVQKSFPFPISETF